MTVHRMPTQRVNHERPVVVISQDEAANEPRTVMGLADEMQALANKVKASRAETGTAWPKAFQEAQKRLMQLPASHYQRGCTLCGGTPTGESHRGFVGKCTCGVPS